MTYILQSRNVRRTGNKSNQSAEGTSIYRTDNKLHTSEGATLEDDKKNTIKYSKNMPIHSCKTADYLGMKSSYSVSRDTGTASHAVKTQKTKDSYQLGNLGSSMSTKLFSELPHPRELFGRKRVKTENRKSVMKQSSVDHHITQLHQKQARYDTERYGKPGDAERYGKPGDAEWYGKLGDAERYGKPGDAEWYWKPGDTERYGKLRDAERYGKPGDAEWYWKPGDTERYGKLGDAERYGKPGDAEWYGKPGDAERYGKPGDAERYGKPGDAKRYGKPGGLRLGGSVATECCNNPRSDCIPTEHVPKSNKTIQYIASDIAPLPDCSYTIQYIPKSYDIGAAEQYGYEDSCRIQCPTQSADSSFGALNLPTHTLDSQMQFPFSFSHTKQLEE